MESVDAELAQVRLVVVQTMLMRSFQTTSNAFSPLGQSHTPLKNVGRSRTDPGSDAESEDESKWKPGRTSPTTHCPNSIPKCPSPLLRTQVDNHVSDWMRYRLAVRRGLQFKRSSPDITADALLKPKTLNDVIGLSGEGDRRSERYLRLPCGSLVNWSNVSVYQQRLLTQCWPNIYATGTTGSFASNLYQTLFNQNAKAKTLMQKVPTPRNRCCY